MVTERHLRVPISALLFVNVVFAGTPLIKSTDGGRTWLDIDPGPPHQGIVELQIARDGSRLYALTVTRVQLGPNGANLLDRRDFSVLSSSDRGRTWEELDALRVINVRSAKLAVAPSDPQTVYVGYEDTDLNSSPLCGIFPLAWALRRSTDGGRTAAVVRGSEQVLRPICKDSGTLWSYTTAFAVHPAISTSIFLALEWYVDFDGNHSGLLSSADAGGTWRLSLKTGFKQLLAEPGEPSTLYARNEEIYTGRPRLAKSTDAGNEWSLKLSDVSSVELSPHNPAILFASRTDGSLWKSTDRAETWQHLGNWLPFDRIMIHPAEPSLVLAQAPALEHQGANTGDIFKSNDGGRSWTVLPSGMDGFSFVFDPTDPDTIYGISEKRLDVRLRPPYIRNLAGGSMLAPGSLFSVYGEDLAGGVTLNGQPADLLFVSRRQINGQVPVGLKPGAAVVEVLRQPANGPSEVDRQFITLSSFPTPVILHDSSGAPLIYHQDSGQPVTDANPARAGERIVVYCASLGEPETRYVQFWPTGRPGMVHPVLFAEPVADQPSVYRVGMEVPPSPGTGSYLLLFWGGRNFARLQVH
jgi:uncharacterized protein (TIGR03437 family)